MSNKTICIIGIVCGLANMIPAFGDGRWYCVLSFVLMGILVAGPAVILFSSKSEKSLRAQSWVNVIIGLSILSLALSDFYASVNMNFINIIVSLVLIASGVMGLYKSVKEHHLPLVP